METAAAAAAAAAQNSIPHLFLVSFSQELALPIDLIHGISSQRGVRNHRQVIAFQLIGATMKTPSLEALETPSD